MQSANTLEIVMAMAAPLGLACASVLMKLPDWLGGVLCGGAFSKRKSALEPVVGPCPEAVDETDTWPSELVSRGASPVQSLVDEMLAQSRYALLLRRQLVGNLTVEQLARTRAALSDCMCLVPEGEVVLYRGTGLFEGEAAAGGVLLRVEAFYLDRYPVTNAQYHAFVANGGYEQMAIWDPEIWPAVLDFGDETGHPGPRFWRKGCYPRGEHKHPVVGVSWYEAAAYARWVGKRLATDAEWIKAGSWPVALAGHPLLQRRYPWGEAMDRGRANLWGSGPGRTVSVEDYPGGVSVGGVQQLIGNVWEWTAEAFTLDDRRPEGDENTSMRSLRGGAFDTYLDAQASCHFQSGDSALARKHNIGFRTAISLCDLTEHHVRDEADQPETSEPSLAEVNP